jgi:hypothetical protein
LAVTALFTDEPAVPTATLTAVAVEKTGPGGIVVTVALADTEGSSRLSALTLMPGGAADVGAV